MHRPALMRLALGVGVSMVMLALSGCGSGSAQQEEAKSRPLPAEEGQPLRPGEYRSGEYKPTFSFEVGKGWSTVELIPPDGFAIGRQGETRWMGFTMFIEEVFKPGTQKVVKAPEDMVGWFEHHPYLKTSKPESVTLGGVKGKQIDVALEVPEDYYGQCGSGDCMDMWMLSTGEALWFVEEDKTRLIILEDVKGNTVVIDIGTSASEFDEYVPEAEKVLDTVKWGGS
jgi:hypothetical protein